MSDCAWLKSLAPALLAVACSSAANGGGSQSRSLTHGPRDHTERSDASVAFEEAAPFEVFAFEPSWSYVAGGGEITFSGRALGAVALEVRFGDVSVAPRIVSESKLTAQAPLHPAGKVWIEVRSSAGRVVRLAERFTYLQPKPSASASLGTLLAVDSDQDGLSDLDELRLGKDPYDPHDGPDIDGDGIPNEDDSNVDGDSEPNADDPDIDDDGIPNYRDSDCDGDGRDNDDDPDDDGDGLLDEEDSDDGDRDPDEPEEPEPDAGMSHDAGQAPEPEPDGGMRKDAGMGERDGGSHPDSEGETGESSGEGDGPGDGESSEEQEEPEDAPASP